MQSPLAIFDRHACVTMRYDRPLTGLRFIAQDLMADAAENITVLVRIHGDTLIIDGAVIERIGLSASTAGDLSQPGLILAEV